MKLVPWLAALMALGLSGLCAQATLPVALQQPDTRFAEDAFENKPAASLVGQVRTNLSAYLYAKAFEYMHGGVVMRAATPREQDFGVRRTSNGDTIDEHHGNYETSVVPENERDVRGVWGYIERECQPFMDVRHHGHKDLKETLPLFRFMTWADPHFVQGYSMGAYLVFSAVEKKGLERAITFLDEGLTNNPNSYVLLKDRGFYTSANLHQPLVALPYLIRSVTLIEKLPAEEREKDIVCEQAVGSLVTTLRKLGRKQEELDWARRGLAMFPAHPTCRRTFRLYGLKPPRLVPGGHP